MKQHTHKYELVKNGNKGNKVYRCIQPNCNHFLAPQFMHGKITICRYCDREFVVTKRTIGSSNRYRKYLQCGCRTKVKKQEIKINAIDDLLKDIV